MTATQKDGASQPTGPRQGCLTGAGSHVSSDQVLAELNRAKALFQMRALATAMGCPSIIRDVDGDGLMMTVEPLQFISPCHEDASA